MPDGGAIFDDIGSCSSETMGSAHGVALVIPVIDEGATIGAVVRAVPRAACEGAEAWCGEEGVTLGIQDGGGLNAWSKESLKQVQLDGSLLGDAVVLHGFHGSASLADHSELAAK